jgi:murein DD-endopeptidase MepM/ murein hydrolase activator NlpD
MPSSNQRPSRQRPFISVRGVLGALALYVLIAVLPALPLGHALFVVELLRRPAPAEVAVPVAGVVARDLRDGWGSPRSGGRRHQGIDIFAPRGTPVVAATDGVVWRVGTDPLGGRVVWVLGPAGQMHYYAHLDRYGDVRAGDRVRVGDVVGYVGTSGNARGGPPHLHYGIYESGGAINPYPLLVPHASRAPSRTSGRHTTGVATPAAPRRGSTG